MMLSNLAKKQDPARGWRPSFSIRSSRLENKIVPLSIIFTAAFLCLILLGRHIHSHRLMFLCVFLYTVMLPGYLAALRFIPRAQGALRILASFVLGTSIAYVVLLAIAVFRLDIRLFGLIAPAIVLALSLWRRSPPGTLNDEQCSKCPETQRGSPWVTATLVILIVAVSSIVIFAGDPLIYTSDSPDHIAYIRTISRTHEAFPDQFYYRDGGILTHDIRKGMGQVLWGTINALTGREDAAGVWNIMSLISSISLILALYCAGRLLYGNARIGLIAAILFVLLYDAGLQGYHLTLSAAGYLFGRAFYVAALAFLPVSIARRRRGDALLAVAAALAAGMTHIAHLATWLLMAVVFIPMIALESPGAERTSRLRRGLLVFTTVALGILPYIAFRYFRDYAPNNPLHTNMQGALFFTHKLFCLNPFVYIQAAGPLGVLAAVSLVVFWKQSRNVGYARLLFVGLIAVYVLLFCPFTYPFLFAKMSYLLIRFELAVPSMLVCAYFLRELWYAARQWRHPGMSPVGAGIAVAAAIAFLGFPLVKIPEGFAYGRHALARAKGESYRNLEDLFAAMNESCPPGSVVASDPITSFGIPAFTDDFVICPFDQHATPNDSTAIGRIADCRRIFEPAASMTKIRGILDAYGAEYLVVNGRIPPSIGTIYWKPDREAARALSERLHEPSSPFRVVFERGDVTMARLEAPPTREAIEEVSRRPAYIGDSLVAEAALCFPPAGLLGIRIASARSSRNEVSRGDTITVNITWVATEKCPFSSCVAFLRFDTDFPKNALYMRAYGKPYRKIVEMITGQRFRFRLDFQPLGGIAPPDTWPSLREIHDRVQVKIPSGIASGAYTVSLKIAEKPQYPNYVLGDILTDDDVYNGAVVTRIRVR